MFVMAEISVRALRFELRPTRAQESWLLRAAGARRFSYNWGLEQWHAYYRQHGVSPPRGLLSRKLTTLKQAGELAWLYELPSQLPQQALFDLERAFKAFFEGRSGYPCFRRKHTTRPTFRIPRGVSVDGQRIFVPRLGWMGARISRTPRGQLGAATFRRDARGRWYVTINDRFETPPRRLPEQPRVVGIDVGLINTVVLSDGRAVPAPRFARAEARRLRRAQRRMARTRAGSGRRAKARKRVAQTHLRTTRRRKAFLHKLTTGVVNEHDVIVMENLSLHGLMRPNWPGASEMRG